MAPAGYRHLSPGSFEILQREYRLGQSPTAKSFQVPPVSELDSSPGGEVRHGTRDKTPPGPAKSQIRLAMLTDRPTTSSGPYTIAAADEQLREESRFVQRVGLHSRRGCARIRAGARGEHVDDARGAQRARARATTHS